MRLNLVNKRLGDMLIDEHKITQDQLEEAIGLQKEKRKKIGELLIDKGYLTEQDVMNTLSLQLNIPLVDFEEIILDKTLTSLIPMSIAKKHVALPMYYEDDGKLAIVINDPLDMFALENLKLMTKKDLKLYLGTKKDILRLIDTQYNAGKAKQAVEEFQYEEAFGEEDTIEIEEISEDIVNAPVVRLVTNIIEAGVKNKASDIHVEPYSDRVRVRGRIDGTLYDLMTLDIRTHSAIITRIKIISELDIAERRKPQDGAIVTTVDDRDIDIRVSILPTIYGEKVVMRIMDQEQFRRKVKDLGFTQTEEKLINDFLTSPHGIYLVTGPTGSGKSTTLYTMLGEKNQTSDNIVTVEDPVECQLDGINQVQVNVKAGLTFPSGLRSILRQDPDIIMIGEIRDKETAEIAVRASITGHLVFSTLHTNNSVATVTRLTDMGIEPYLVATALKGVISQRLIRRLCPKCKKPYMASKKEKEVLGQDPGKNLEIYYAKGCSACNNTGYQGRIAVHEVLKIDKTLRKKIIAEAGFDEMFKYAKSQGMETLSENVIALILEGVTSLSEGAQIVYHSIGED